VSRPWQMRIGGSLGLGLIAGLDRPTTGRIVVNGVELTGLGEDALARFRRDAIGYVFQSFHLIPTLTALENVAVPLELGGEPDALERARALLSDVGLEERAHHYPVQLSGGEQQRVAVARALVTRPAVLLLDEPLGALDKQLRDHMQIELKGLQREIGVTTIYVTHDQEEALTMSDRIAVMRGGRLEQVGTPREIYETPATVFVASFIGNTNLLSARALGGAEVEWGRARVRTAGAAGGPGASVTVALRPERIQLEPDVTADNVVPTAVAHVVYQGETVRYVLRTEEGLELQAVELGQIRFAAGARVRAGWAAADARVLER